jgi:hypothetical protein
MARPVAKEAVGWRALQSKFTQESNADCRSEGRPTIVEPVILGNQYLEIELIVRVLS